MIIIGDCQEKLLELDENSIDTCITDPPYELGFMGKSWDNAGVSFQKETWEKVYRVLKPGGFLLAFGGTRTWHRIAVAIEDAGFEIRDTICWLYGSGFPKSYNIGKGIDKKAGKEGEIIGKNPNARPNSDNRGEGVYGGGKGSDHSPNLTAPATPEAELWEGYGTALKPAFEPILLCRKPLTTVPFDAIIDETQTLLGGMLCLLLSNANNAKKISQLSPPDLEGVSVSVQMLVAMLHGAKSGDLYEKMDMFSSQEMVLTCLNIAISWSNILDEILRNGNTFTTSTVSELITELRILNYLLFPNIPKEAIKVVSRPVGYKLDVSIVDNNLKKEELNIEKQHTTFAAEIASLHTLEDGLLAKNVASNLIPIIPSVVSVLYHVQQLITTEKEKKISPEFEPIIVAMKPIDGTYVDNALEHGVSGLWIDGGRISPDEKYLNGYSSQETKVQGQVYGWAESEKYVRCAPNDNGRWPANVILDETSAEMLDEQSGNSKSKKGKPRGTTKKGMFANSEFNKVGSEYDDSGGASRFYYCAKASKKERNMGLEGINKTEKYKDFGLNNRIENGEITNPRTNNEATKTKNFHPTVKPLALMQYLVRLTKTPTGGIVLDPFMGSGTTGMACVLENRDFIGIEMDEEYAEIAKLRIEASRKLQPQLKMEI